MRGGISGKEAGTIDKSPRMMYNKNNKSDLFNKRSLPNNQLRNSRRFADSGGYFFLPLIYITSCMISDVMPVIADITAHISKPNVSTSVSVMYILHHSFCP